MYVIDVLREFIKDFDEFLSRSKNSVCEEGFYVLINDYYILVDPRISYWRLEDDGTVVYVINDEDELEFIKG